MSLITAETLAYDLEAIITHYGDRLPEAVVAHVRGDLDRWEAQQVDTEEGCRILKQWLQDRGYFLQTIAGLDERTIRQMARDYVAFLKLFGTTELNEERMVCLWQGENTRLTADPSTRGGDGEAENGTRHSIHPY